MVSIIASFAKQVGYKKGDLYPIMLLSGIFICMMAVMCIFPFRGYPLMPLGIMKGAVGFGVDYTAYMLMVIPSIFIICFGWALVMRFTPGCDASLMTNVDLSAMKAKYPDGMTKMQKAVVACMLVYLAVCVFISFVGGSSPFILALKNFSVYGWSMVAFTMYMVIHVDGKPILDMKRVGNYFQWDTIFVIISATLVANVMTSAETGVSAFVTKMLNPIVGGMGEFGILVFLGFVTLVLTNFMNNMGVTITMLAVCFSLYAQGMIQNIEIAVITIGLLGMCGVMTPAASIYGAMLHGFEMAETKPVYINGIITIIYMTAITAFVMVPLGLLVF